eukprot:scaffold66331_cov45-Phaeocystis_antarctica.AAC.1
MTETVLPSPISSARRRPRRPTAQRSAGGGQWAVGSGRWAAGSGRQRRQAAGGRRWRGPGMSSRLIATSWKGYGVRTDALLAEHRRRQPRRRIIRSPSTAPACGSTAARDVNLRAQGVDR